MKRLIRLLFSATLLLTACTYDAYDKGEGNLSRVQADFGEALVDADKQVYRVITDDGEALAVAAPFTQQWVQKADTVYRVLFYYKRAAAADAGVEAVSCGKVSVAGIVPVDSVKGKMMTDPVRLESVWLSKNRRYLNVGFYLKSGTTSDEKAVHSLGIVADTLLLHPDGKTTLCLRLYHDQGGVPQYYSQRSYISIPMAGIKTDSVTFSANTYDGEKTSRLQLAE
jgi:hypothetical protein